MLFWFLCLVKLLKYYNNLENSKNDFNKKVFLSAIGSIFVLLIISFFENYLSATTVMIPVSMLVPLAVGLNFQDKLQAQS